MKLLFSMRHAGALRNFASTIGELARRGHEVRLVFMRRDKRGDEGAVRDMVREYPSVSSEEVGDIPVSSWSDVAEGARAAADYLRYLAPEYRDAHALRDRAEARVPARWRAALAPRVMRTRTGAAAASAMLRAIEHALPPSPSVMKRVARHAPDAVLVTPLVDLGSGQVEYIKAARALGVRCGLCVHSWDNLTNKGLIHVRPDRVFVWNDAQRREAVHLHRIPAGDVVVTGAPVFDQWFERGPSTTRDAFCRTIGLPATKPFFLYLCSSQFIAPREDDFIRTWIRAVRSASDPHVRDAGILVRLHPRTQPRHAVHFAFPEFEHVAVWPQGGANPVNESSKNDYFDSLYHAAAAVGINTSAQIEAGVVGRPVFSIRVPAYAATQEGTLHFHYLLRESGGLLNIADTLDEHTRQLAGALNGGVDRDRLQTFVRGFVRPDGLDQPATPRLADAIEALAALPKPAPRSLPVGLYPVRLALYPFAGTRRAAAPLPARPHLR
jgi:hypothetical protein